MRVFINSFATVNVYTLSRKDRNRYGGGVALYIQEDTATVLAEGLMNSNNEILWVRIHIAYSKAALIGCPYRPPSSALCYLDKLCSNMGMACDDGKYVFIFRWAQCRAQPYQPRNKNRNKCTPCRNVRPDNSDVAPKKSLQNWNNYKQSSYYSVAKFGVYLHLQIFVSTQDIHQNVRKVQEWCAMTFCFNRSWGGS